MYLWYINHRAGLLLSGMLCTRGWGSSLLLFCQIQWAGTAKRAECA